ncbi:MAG: hypothetical protein A2252_08185 [Elusimicrobia bacterium RIFOXYA2_FULL_39_19]|nr:MAG: hypothetical protein A2252_08185 [Elusimicrobia bacterium RIFOXYA2_FULL_39_19]
MENKKLLDKDSLVVMVVDDEVNVVETFKVLLDKYNVLGVNSGPAAIDVVNKQNVDLIILDILMEGMDGLETLKRIRAINSDVEIIVVTAVKTVKTAIEAMKLGAYDYIMKPFDADEMLLSVERAFERKRLNKEVVYLRSEIKPTAFENIIGNSEPMKRIFELVFEMCKTDSNVMVLGESGTGKDLVAKALHYNSNRKNGPFVVVDCASIPENLIESELFGHEKGAFTDAISQKLGKFELADNGTVFLDEIGTLPMNLQSKLLRVIETREFQRVGGIKDLKINARIISATNMDIKKAIKDGKFREDLYYRLNVVPINLPPLRERKKDLSLLIDYYIKFFNKKFSKNITSISKQAMNILKNYDWPGNVRELKNIVERMVALSKDSVITHNRFPLDIFMPEEFDKETVPEEKRSLVNYVCGQYEKKFVIGILEKVNWNQTKAAKLMGIHRNTLIYKMKILGIQSAK